MQSAIVLVMRIAYLWKAHLNRWALLLVVCLLLLNNGAISGKLVSSFYYLETASNVQSEAVLNRSIFEWLKKQGKTARRQGKRRAWQGALPKAGQFGSYDRDKLKVFQKFRNFPKFCHFFSGQNFPELCKLKISTKRSLSFYPQ